MTKRTICGKKWVEGNVKNGLFINDPNQRVSNFNCSKAIWTSLNKIRTEQSKYNYLLHIGE